MPRRLALAGLALAGFLLALPFAFPWETVLAPRIAAVARRAGVEVSTGAVRYAFPRTLVLGDVTVRGDLGDRPFDVHLARAAVTPAVSTLWGRPAARVEIDLAGGTVRLDVEAGPPRRIDGHARGLALDRLPVGIALPWRVRGTAGGGGTLRWSGSLIDAEGDLAWEATGIEVDGVRWLDADWPTIRADRAEGRIAIGRRRLDVRMETHGGNNPVEVEGSVSLLDRFASSPVDLDIRMRPAPDVVTALGRAGDAIGRARTADGVVALRLAGPVEKAEAEFR